MALQNNNLSTYKTLTRSLQQKISALPFKCLQFFFGVYVAFYYAKHLYFNWISPLYVTPNFHATYPFMPSFQLPHLAHVMLFVLLIILSLCIAVGFRTKWMAFVSLIASSFYFVYDSLYYSDFAYLHLLLLLLTACFGLDSTQVSIKKWKLLVAQGFAWIVFALNFAQLLSYDFIQGFVIQSRLARFEKFVFLGPLASIEGAKTAATIIIFSWGICLITLMTKKSRKFGLAFWIILQFCLYTIFYKYDVSLDRQNLPILLVITSLLFIDPRWIKRANETPPAELPNKTPSHESSNILSTLDTLNLGTSRFKQNLITGAILLFICGQLLLPLRGYLNNHSQREWTSANNLFSWRMKLKQFQYEGYLTVTHTQTGQRNVFDIRDFHYKNSSFRIGYPYSIYQFAQFLKKKYQNKGIHDIAIYPTVFARLNNQGPVKYLLDPDVNLLNVDYHYLKPNDWILLKDI